MKACDWIIDKFPIYCERKENKGDKVNEELFKYLSPTKKDIDVYNYIEKNKMYFNSYKTAKTYGCQVIDIPKALQTILKKWININPTKTLFDANMNPLSSVKLSQRITHGCLSQFNARTLIKKM
jgi:hypothetical protein